MAWKREPSSIRVEGDVAYVELGRGLEAMIDVADVPLIAPWGWRAHIGTHGHAYAVRCGKGYIAMHRVLTDAPSEMYVDHANGDGLDNRRANMRLATQTQNMANKAVERRNLLGLKGVSAARGKFRATITPNGRKIHLGTFKTPEEAAAAYRGAAVALWGDFAKN
ncbi:HNH endonuclease [Methylobacterium terricola]|nr:HNH endonuclease [Methylobacterium terricola]